MTTREFTAATAAALQAIYPEREAQAVAVLVVEQLLDMDSLQRMMDAQEPVPPAAQAAFPPLLTRLLAHEPVQYVLGTAYFDELALEVTPATLIPRPETEELLRVLRQERPDGAGWRVLDVGTGSGCLAIALARTWPTARVLAVDISAEALAVARRNAARYAPEVAFQCLDALREWPAGLAPGDLDVLVSNPPYVRECERPLMRANVLAWEPATALFVPDDDPLLFYRRLAELGRELLRPGGVLCVEINEALGPETAAVFAAPGFEDVRVLPDLFGKARVVCGRRS